jgi:uncharacterized protein
MRWDFAIILLFLGVAVPWLGYRRVRRLMGISSTSTMDRLTLYASTIAFQWVAVAIILWRAEKQGIHPKELGLAVPNPWLAASVSIILSLLLLMNQVFAMRRLSARPSEAKGVLPQLALKIFPQNAIEKLVFVALVATVAVCEETIYRGFVQQVFQGALDNLIIAGIVLSAVLFSLAHAYQGPRGLLSTLIIGLVFASARSWTGSLVPSISAHFVADLTVGLLASSRLRAALVTQQAEAATGPD